MRFAVFTKEDELSNNAKEKIIKELLLDERFSYDEEKPQLVISIGGDGCMLRCVKKFIHLGNAVTFTGISSGHLGYLCDYQIDELDELVLKIKTIEPKYRSYRLIQMNYHNENHLYLNECVIEKPFATTDIKLKINGHLFEHIKSNGISFSTPLGSSGYNRSLGGSLINTDLPCFTMVEISPIKNRVYDSVDSPLVLKDSDVIECIGNFKGCYIGGDFSSSICEDDVEQSIIVTMSNKCALFSHYKYNSYYKRLKKGVIGD